METTNNNISYYATHFFNKLSNHLDTKLYFYGSVQRKDYFPEESDIDVAIFSDNISSTINKLQDFLQIKKENFKKFVWKLYITDKIVNGIKYIHIDEENDLKCEFCIYDEKFKNDLLIEYKDKINLPFYSIIMLKILKMIYYKFKLISLEWYRYFKRRIITYLSGKHFDNNFILLD